MSDTFQLTTNYETVECSCGGVYALPADYINHKRKHGGGWRCPYCTIDNWGYHGDNTEIARLRKQVASETARHDQTKAALESKRREAELNERRRRAAVGAKTKLEKRIKNGVCPCCTRLFTNLQRHMTTEHPDYAVAETES
jgi:hypothetical protein